MRQVAIYTKDYINAAMSIILSPNKLPVEGLRSVIRYIESQIPSIIHLPISLDDTLHFYQYFKTHMLIPYGWLLLLINVPIQNRAQQLKIYEIVYLSVPHSDISAHYKINNKHIGVTYDETQAAVITKQQYSTCLYANGQFYKIDVPFQALTNPSPCIAALYAKNDQQIGAQCSLSIFHTPPAFTPTTITSNLSILIPTLLHNDQL